MYTNFVDIIAAFDSIDRQFIWRSLQNYGLPEKYIRIMKAFFSHTNSALRINGELIYSFSHPGFSSLQLLFELFGLFNGTGEGC